MANSEAGTSNDAVPASRCEYQVFLSFRGPDTRHGFTDFLYNGLLDVGVYVFRDDDELRVGEVIGENLLSAINNSIIYIPIFSRTYASSKWCLWELAHIVDNVSRSENEKCILPIFLDVEPDDVKLKTPIYSKALSKHGRKFGDKVKAWRDALETVGKIKGWNVTSSQAAIVKLVVNEVLEKLKIKQKSVTKDLVGLDNRIKELTKLLDVNTNDVQLVGIYGMGGIGKTTIATVVFNQLCSHFGKCCSFLGGIRERSTKEGIVSLQKQLLFDIGSFENVENINNSEQAMRRIGATLKNKKVLVVLDDVDEKVLIKNLIGNFKLYEGSRVIITTRDRSVLEVEGFKGKTRQYEMLKMDANPALQLFGRHAFSGDFPLDNYRQLSSDIVSSTGGLPLAIEVIGSLLNGKPQEIWEEKLEKLRNVPETKILEKLRISYDDLEKNHKQIFLDIACFLFNENKIDAIYMWTDCQFCPKEGIEVLIDRCLIKILDNNKLWIHDQLIALGRQIVREDSLDCLGMQSRLWIAEEALQIIGTKEMKDKVQGFVMSRDDPPIEITNENFENLPNLRFLNLNGGTFGGDFTKCHSKLRWFSWSNCSANFLRRDNLDWQFKAGNLYLDKLVVCKLCNIDFGNDSKAWDLIKGAQMLKVLSITRCPGITTIPNLSRCLALERLTLHRCFRLKRIESFIGDLSLLIELKIKGCSYFTDLPEEVGALVKLEHFSLKDCGMLRELPCTFGNLTSLTKLNLSGTGITKLPNSIVQLRSLRILYFQPWSCQFQADLDWQLPSGFSTLVNLEELSLFRCDRMKGEIPIGIGKCSSLKILNLTGTGICKIPKTIKKLHQLQTLDLIDCHEIQELPELPTSLTHLLLQSMSLLSVPNLSSLTNLVELLLSNDHNKHKPKPLIGCDFRWIRNLSRLKNLCLDLRNVPVPLELASLSHLKELHLRRLDLKPLVQLPSSDWNWRNLLTLEIYCCKGHIPLEGFLRLKNLDIASCFQLKRLSIPSELRELQTVNVSQCPDLVEIQIGNLSKSLKNLRIDVCKSLTRVSGLSYLKHLSDLRICSCDVLTNVEGLNELESLKSLLVRNCWLLTRVIDALGTKVPDDCYLNISNRRCNIGYCSAVMSLEDYREEILSNKFSCRIKFHLGVKKSSERFEFVGGIKRKKEYVHRDLVTYEELVADVRSFGFCLKRMWYKYPRWVSEIKSAGVVDRILRYTSGLSFHLFVEGGVDSEWEGEYDEEMMEMLREERRMKVEAYSDEDEAKWWGFSPLDNSSPMGNESESHGTSSVDLVTSQTSFTIRFHFGIKKFSDPFEWGCIGGIEREKKGVDPDSVTYEGLIADVKNFGFRLNRMWYEVPITFKIEIKSDWDVNLMLNRASTEGSLIHLLVEGGVDSEWEGGYDEEMMKILREEQRMKTNVDDLGNVRKQVELHEEHRYEETTTLKQEDIFLNALNKVQYRQKINKMMELPFVIEFHLGVKKSTEGFEFVGVIKWEKGDVAPDSVTYRGLIADVNDLGFRLKRMWFRFPGEDHDLPLEIESDEQVKRMVQLASEKGSVRLFVEVGIDICLQGAILWASQRDYSVHFLFFLFALFLSLLLSRIFLGKLEFLNFFSGKSGYYLECVLILLGILANGWFSLGSPSKDAMICVDSGIFYFPELFCLGSNNSG